MGLQQFRSVQRKIALSKGVLPRKDLAHCTVCLIGPGVVKLGANEQKIKRLYHSQRFAVANPERNLSRGDRLYRRLLEKHKLPHMCTPNRQPTKHQCSRALYFLCCAVAMMTGLAVNIMRHCFWLLHCKLKLDRHALPIATEHAQAL